MMREIRLEWLLRLGVAACFIGHGVFGLMRKPAWLDYFAALGLGPEAAQRLMPLIGALDIAVGLAVLTRPAAPVLIWAVAWGIWTAALRPLAGEPFWETLERAGNYGVPLALLLLVRARAGGARAGAALARVAVVLQVSTVLLLLGHGALAAGGKAELGAHLASVGIAPGWLPLLGAFEVALALTIALRPSWRLLIGAAGWKVATEALFLTAGAPVWEFVERGGSYAAPLGLALLLRTASVVRAPASVTAARRAPRPRPGVPALLLLALLPTAAAAQAGGSAEGRWEARAREVPRGTELDALVADLRAGGLVLLCRHAITDHSQGDRGSTREMQRNLSEAGRAQARRMGEALRALGVPVDDVRASPMFRTMDSAELAFGRAAEDARLRGAANRPALRLLLAERPPSGNRLLMTHQGTIRSVVPIGRAPLEEGDCLVLRPEDGAVDLLGRVGAADWERAR